MQKLIALLRENARLSNAQLAVMLGKTEEQVAEEIQKLENDGIIKGYSVVLNEEAVNPDTVTAIIELRVTPQPDCGFEEIARQIMQYDEVESISLMAGAYDFAITVKGANVKEVSMFVSQRLATIGNVISTATYFMLKKYKEKGIIIEDEEKDERGFYYP